MNILIAPNAFKNSLDATAAAAAIAKGLKLGMPRCNCHQFPVGDGGDGTGALLADHLHAVTVNCEVDNPLGKRINSRFYWRAEDQTAIIEMADASGLRLVAGQPLQPLRASSMGTGQLMRSALNKGAKEMLLCMGGSATVDGGIGILHALGVRFLDADHNEVEPLPINMRLIHSVDITGMDTRIQDCTICILCDVQNPLLGDNGAAKIFGPQKGAGKEEIVILEQGLAMLAAAIEGVMGSNISNIPMTGAAGGAAAGLLIINAELLSGSEFFLERTGFDLALQNADLVITGEGMLDAQSLQGKAPFAVAKLAKQMNKPVIAFCGAFDEGGNELRQYFRKIITINSKAHDLAYNLAHTDAHLQAAAERLGAELGNKGYASLLTE